MFVITVHPYSGLKKEIGLEYLYLSGNDFITVVVVEFYKNNKNNILVSDKETFKLAPQTFLSLLLQAYTVCVAGLHRFIDWSRHLNLHLLIDLVLIESLTSDGDHGGDVGLSPERQRRLTGPTGYGLRLKVTSKRRTCAG